MLLPSKNFPSQRSICPILASCLQGQVGNLSIVAALAPEWLWETAPIDLQWTYFMTEEYTFVMPKHCDLGTVCYYSTS